MKINKTIQKRCSTRTFLDKTISQEAINTVIDAGRLAPSTKNSQPWLYIQLNTQQKDSVVQELIRVAKSNDAPLCALMTATAEAMRQAPVLILVFFTKNDEYFYNSYLLSIGASIENCLLQATELGIQSLWNCDITSINKEFFKKLLNINYDLIAGISLGYSNHAIQTKTKKTLDEIFIINKD